MVGRKKLLRLLFVQALVAVADDGTISLLCHCRLLVGEATTVENHSIVTTEVRVSFFGNGKDVFCTVGMVRVTAKKLGSYDTGFLPDFCTIASRKSAPLPSNLFGIQK